MQRHARAMQAARNKEVPYETSERVVITAASSQSAMQSERERDKERLAVRSRFSTEITDLFVLFSPQAFF